MPLFPLTYPLRLSFFLLSSPCVYFLSHTITTGILSIYSSCSHFLSPWPLWLVFCLLFSTCSDTPYFSCFPPSLPSSFLTPPLPPLPTFFFFVSLSPTLPSSLPSSLLSPFYPLCNHLTLPYMSLIFNLFCDVLHNVMLFCDDLTTGCDPSLPNYMS